MSTIANDMEKALEAMLAYGDSKFESNKKLAVDMAFAALKRAKVAATDQPTAENAIFVRIETVYGKITLYPACDKARAFCDIAGTKTITPTMTHAINTIGFKVYEDPTEVALRKVKLGVSA